jgi:tRNA(fMet)-specific endonuclease VapC
VTHYLLDTNIISDLVRHPRGRVAERIAEVGPQNVCTSIIVAAELKFGVLKKRSAKLARQLQDICDAIDVLPFDQAAANSYAIVRWQLEATGRPIGANDLLIAAHALAADCTLVTNNMREFRRIERILVENWLDPR